MAKDCNIKPRLPIQDDFRKLEETTVKAVLDYDSVIQNLIVNLRAKELLNNPLIIYLIYFNLFIIVSSVVPMGFWGIFSFGMEPVKCL